MALTKLRLRPGVNTTFTQTLNEGSWSQSQLVRFFGGLVQKIGGWLSISTTGTLIGTCRGIFGWSDFTGTAHLAVGTEQRLSVVTAGALGDITPITWTTNANPTMSTTAGSTTVGLTDSTYSPSPGDWIYLPVPISQGGVIIAGYYQVGTTPTSTAFSITATTLAALTTAAGGLVPSLTTATGSALVVVYLPDHGYTAGQTFSINVSLTLGGLTLSGIYTVASVLDSASFQFSAYSIASGTATAALNSGHMRIQYLLPTGHAVAISSGGWGAGPWGGGLWGVVTPGVTLIERARVWSLDHYGQNLIACPDMGGIYTWAPPNVTPATLVDASAPVTNHVVFAIAQAQILMACGSSVSTTFYPTLIRWCDSGDFTDWTASAINQAGSYQIPTGSYITAALAVGLGALVWTDVDLWQMTYQGLPYVFGFNQIAVGCEAISSRAPAVAGSLIIWPSLRGFFSYQGGAVVPMECPVWDYFYNNLDTLQTDLVFAAVNTEWHEIGWFFPIVNQYPAMGYVKLNYVENVWDYGTLDRTAWCDHSPYGPPTATSSAGVIYQHEVGTDDDGQPMTAYAETGYIDVKDGDVMAYVNTIIPDFVASAGSTIDVSVFATDYPNGTVRTYGPFAVSPTTPRINCSLRGRQIAFRFSSQDLSSSWRMGAVRYSVTEAGRRP
jgi:hypothetical protein